MRRLTLLIGAMALVLGVSLVSAQDDAPEEFVGREEFPAPEFPPGVDWLNVPAPLTMEQLRGKVVLLDFWTYGCINCIHMIPILEELEAKYADELVVIGVHSAKFENEGETDNIRQIVQRYDLVHPVINDNQFTIWRLYRARAWPTFTLIDPRGNILAMQAGEIPFEAFDRVISGMVEYFDSTGELNREPLELALERDTQPNRALAFPGKVLVDDRTNRLFITDSNHHRIIITDLLTYEVLDVIGTGSAGFDNGPFAEATFNQPQGITLDENILYVADTKNHAIRAVDLSERTVSTIAGTGEQSYNRDTSGPADSMAIASPWDVEISPNGDLYIAMAGPHQLWSLDLNANVIGPLVGSGREGLVDGPLAEAELAQPSGLYYVDGKLYFADSESSSIRVADVEAGVVETLAGPIENTLFDFGDQDGEVGVSRLQHALGVTGKDGLLYVADTYNSKIKLINLGTTETTSVFGLGGLGGFRDGGADVAEFDEPGGLDYADGKLYVADTNNHAIRVIDLETETVSTITFPNPEVLQIGERPTVVAGNSADGVQIDLPGQMVAAGESEIVLNIELPEGYKLNDLAPFTGEWVSSGEAITIDEVNRQQSIIEPDLPIRVPVRLNAGEDLLHADLTIYYCEVVNQSLCFIDRVSIDAPVTVTADSGAASIAVDHTVVPPQITDVGGI